MKLLAIAKQAVASAVAVAVAKNAREIVAVGERKIREGVKTVKDGYERRRQERVR